MASDKQGKRDQFFTMLTVGHSIEETVRDLNITVAPCFLTASGADDHVDPVVSAAADSAAALKCAMSR